ncbi:hypothetical protein [Streptomyces griseus]|uniref:hypothetical protein n=1 Tax=Streptomyces griseus TaxID=1911 RepID=UPI00055B2717|nr:hypothetical protein [Streptomyces griseus]
MSRSECEFPITVTVTGRPSAAGLAQLGQAVEEALAVRLREAANGEMWRIRPHPPQSVAFEIGPVQPSAELAGELESILLTAVDRALAGLGAGGPTITPIQVPAVPVDTAAAEGGGSLLAFSVSESALANPVDTPGKTDQARPVGQPVAFRPVLLRPGTGGARRLTAHVPSRPARRNQIAGRGGPPAKHSATARPAGGPARLTFKVVVKQAMAPTELLREFVRQYYRAGSEQEVDRWMVWWRWGSPEGRSVSQQEADDRGFVELTVTDATQSAVEALSPAEQEQINAETDERFWRESGLPPGTKLGTGPEDADRRARWRGARADVVEEHTLRRELSALPEDIRSVLFAGDRPMTVEGLRSAVQLGRKLATMTPEQRADYLAKVTGETTNWAAMDASIDRYLQDQRLREAEVLRTEEAAASLFGCEELYKLWRAVQLLENRRGDEHDEDTSIELAETRKRFKEALARHGFADEEAFAAAVEAYRLQFRAAAVRLGLDLLGHVDHQLHEERTKLCTPGYVEHMVAAIATSSACADFAAASTLRSRTTFNPELGDFVPEQGVNQAEAEALSTRAGQSVVEASGHDLLVDPDRMGRGTDLERLIGVDTDTVRTYLLGVADGLQGQSATVRGELADDPERVFSQEALVKAAKRAQEVERETIYDWIIDDHIAAVGLAHLFSSIAVAAIALFLAALVPVGGWVAAAALVAGTGLSVYQAMDAITQYRYESAEYDLSFIRNEPSLFWVVIAVAATVVEVGTTTAQLLKGSAKGLFALRRPLLDAARAADAETAAARYQALITKIDEVEGLEPKLRAVLKAHAAAEQGLSRVVGEFAGRLHGGFLIDPTGPIKAMYYAVKKGVATVTKLRSEARMLELLGDVTKLSRAERAAITTAFKQVKKIVALGERQGMDEARVLRYIDRLAAERSEAVFNEITAEMRAWRPPTLKQLRAEKELVDASQFLEHLRTERENILAELRAGPKTPSGTRDTLRIAELRKDLAHLEDAFSTDRSGVRRLASEGDISRAQRRLREAGRLAEAARVDPVVRMRQVFNASAERARVAAGKVDRIGRLRATSGRVQVDHVVSLERMTKMEGFELLTTTEQNVLAVRPDNLKPMDAAANASKGALSWREWRYASNYYVDPADIARWQARDAELTESIQTWIRDTVRGRRPATTVAPAGARPAAGVGVPPAKVRVEVEPARVRVEVEPAQDIEALPAEFVEAEDLPAVEAPKQPRRVMRKPER